jgi:hypothetical protein
MDSQETRSQRGREMPEWPDSYLPLSFLEGAGNWCGRKDTRMNGRQNEREWEGGIF